MTLRCLPSKVEGASHFESPLVFARNGTLFVTHGERFDYRDQAQDLSSGLGKVIRINPDGSVPRDVLQAQHAMLFLHRRLEGRPSVVEVLRLPLQDLLLTPERRAIANASPG
jgi:hypothetical protein